MQAEFSAQKEKTWRSTWITLTENVELRCLTNLIAPSIEIFDENYHRSSLANASSAIHPVQSDQEDVLHSSDTHASILEDQTTAKHSTQIIFPARVRINAKLAAIT